MSQQTDLKIMTTHPLTSSLETAKRQVLAAATPQKRFVWLVVQAAIEAKINRTKLYSEPVELEPKRGIIE